jgi:flagellar hook-associated protein 1 FlgK
MRSTFMGIETSKRSLFTHQTSLQTTAHNMANANTVGYSRQSVNHVSSIPMEALGLQRSNTPGQLGTGVEFDYIKRIRETFLDDQYRNESQAHGDWNMRADTLEKLETIINEPSDTGIRTVVENFWNAWQELSKSPENLTARVLVKETALALTDAFNHSASQLANLSVDLTKSITAKATQADTLLSGIASLNQEIYRIEGFGDNANDLRDQRDLLVDELSQLANVTVEEMPNGYTVRMGGTELVNGNAKNVTIDTAYLEGAYGGALTGGEIHGLIYSRDTYVAGYIADLNKLADSIVNGQVEVTLPVGTVIPNGASVGGVTYSGTIANRTLNAPLTVTINGINELHQLGYKMDGTRGEPLFTMTTGSEALTFGVNTNIVNDVSGIVSSNRVVLENGIEVTVKGNNEMALQLAGLQLKKVNGEGKIDEIFQSIVGKLGVQSQEAGRQTKNLGVLVDQVDIRRHSVSGVSLDEEMSNMIKFQHAYNSAARIMTAFDEMLDKVINGMGIVGR